MEKDGLHSLTYQYMSGRLGFGKNENIFVILEQPKSIGYIQQDNEITCW